MHITTDQVQEIHIVSRTIMRPKQEYSSRKGVKSYRKTQMIARVERSRRFDLIAFVVVYALFCAAF